MKKTIVLLSLGILLGSSAAFAASKIFSDVPTDAWYTAAVNNLSSKGIINGYPDGTFGPGKNVSRAEVAIMLNNTIQYLQTGKVVSSDLIYTNSTYGFSLTFPQTWKGYTATNRALVGSTNSIDFGFSTLTSLFNVSIYTKSQWEANKSTDGPTPDYLGENNQYVFGYDSAQAVPNDTMYARLKEVQNIVKTFKVTQ